MKISQFHIYGVSTCFSFCACPSALLSSLHSPDVDSVLHARLQAHKSSGSLVLVNGYLFGITTN